MKPHTNLKILNIALLFLLSFIPQFICTMEPMVEPELAELPAPMLNNFLKPHAGKKLNAPRSSSPHPKYRHITPAKSSSNKAEAEIKFAHSRAVAYCPAIKAVHTRLELDVATGAYDKKQAPARELILVEAFKQLPVKKKPKKEKPFVIKQHIKRLPLSVQKQIGHMYLDLTHNNLIRQHTKELMPAVIDHHTEDPASNIFLSINQAEARLKKVLAEQQLAEVGQINPHVEQSRPVHRLLEAPLNDDDQKRIAEKFGKHYAYFDGSEEEAEAFIAQIMDNGSIKFYLNAHNRNRLRTLDREQVKYLINLYNAPNKLQCALAHKKIHKSLPQGIKDQVEDNYEFLLPSAWASWKCW